MSGLEITRVSWDATAALDTADVLGREALERAGERLLAAAAPRTPYRTGALAASAQLVAGDDGVAVGYTAPHARYVHAHPEWQFGGGRSGRWLERRPRRGRRRHRGIDRRHDPLGLAGLTKEDCTHGHHQDPGARLHDRDRHRVPGHARLDRRSAGSTRSPRRPRRTGRTPPTSTRTASPSTWSWSAASSSRSPATTSKTP